MNDKKLIKSGINKCVNIERIYIVGKSWWEETRLVDCLPLGRGATKRGVASGKWQVAGERRKEKGQSTQDQGGGQTHLPKWHRCHPSPVGLARTCVCVAIWA